MSRGASPESSAQSSEFDRGTNHSGMLISKTSKVITMAKTPSDSWSKRVWDMNKFVKFIKLKVCKVLYNLMNLITFNYCDYTIISSITGGWSEPRTAGRMPAGTILFLSLELEKI